MTQLDETVAVVNKKSDELISLTKDTGKKALRLAKGLPAKASTLYERSLKDIPSSEALAKVSFWSGLASIPFGFPANVIALVSAAAVEDRRRLVAKGAIKKILEKKTAPSSDDLLKSRIGAAAGAFSLIVGLITVAVVLSKAKNSKLGESS